MKHPVWVGMGLGGQVRSFQPKGRWCHTTLRGEQDANGLLWTIVSLMPDTPAPIQLPAQMPQPRTWAKSLLPGHQSTGRRATMSSSSDLPPPQSCWWAVLANFSVPASAWGREKEEGLPPPQAVSGGLWSWGRGYTCGKLAEAAGSRRESGKNDIKPGKMQAGWRAQAGPGRWEGGREGGGPTDRKEEGPGREHKSWFGKTRGQSPRFLLFFIHRY